MRRLLLVVLATFAVAAGSQERGRPSEMVYLHGSALQLHRALAPSDLAALPVDRQETFVQARGAPGQESRTVVRGARLADLVDAQLRPSARADWKNLLVTVTATDGYRAHFTWVELSNTPAGRGVLLVFERDGQPLDAREGAIALLSTGDLRLGARHVRNVVRVEVRGIGD